MDLEEKRGIRGLSPEKKPFLTPIFFFSCIANEVKMFHGTQNIQGEIGDPFFDLAYFAMTLDSCEYYGCCVSLGTKIS